QESYNTGACGPRNNEPGVQPVVFNDRMVGDQIFAEEFPWYIFQNVKVSTVQDRTAGGDDVIDPNLFELIVNNSVRDVPLVFGFSPVTGERTGASINMQGALTRTGFGGELKGLWIHEGACVAAAKLPQGDNCDIGFDTAVDVLEYGFGNDDSATRSPRIDRA